MQLAVKLPGGNEAVADDLAQFVTWLGRTPDYLTVFLSGSHWTNYDPKKGRTGEFIASGYHLPYYLRTGIKPLLSVPLCLVKDPASLLLVAEGKKDGEFVREAKRIASRIAEGPILLRLGWELNGDWYGWGTTNPPALFRDAWLRVASIFTGESDRFKFIWNLAVCGSTQSDCEDRWPGDEDVDYIGVDVYWHKKHFGVNPVKAFDYVRTHQVGLDQIAAFAKMKGKPLMVEEWGADPQDGNPFVDRLIDWMDSHDVVLQGLWDSNAAFESRISGTHTPTAMSYLTRFHPAAEQRWQNLSVRVLTAEDNLSLLRQHVRDRAENLSTVLDQVRDDLGRLMQ